MSDNKGQKTSSANPTVPELQAEIRGLRERIDAAAVKFDMKDRLTRLVLRAIPRHTLFNARWDMAEVFSATEINAVVDYIKGVLPEEALLLDSYRPEILCHRNAVEAKKKLDEELAAEKAKEPSPIKAPVLDMKPLKVGTGD